MKHFKVFTKQIKDTEEIQDKFHFEQPVVSPRFEHGTSRMEVQIDD
jgi:hypothetical protein